MTNTNMNISWHQLTMSGWDGTFTWSVGVPAPTDVTSDVSQTGSFTPPSFDGFNAPGERGGNGPTQGPPPATASSGPFPYGPRSGDTVMGNRRDNE